MSKYAKFITALLAAAGVFASSGLLTGTAEVVLNTIIAAVGAALVYLVPNTPAAARRQGAGEAYHRPGV